MSSRILLLLGAVLASLLTRDCVQAFSAGAPSTTCPELRPEHYGATELQDDAGCTLMPQEQAPGGLQPSTLVSLELSCPEQFKGFHIQCRAADGSIVGQFEPLAGQQSVNCNAAQNTPNGLTHTNSALKATVQAVYMPDASCQFGFVCRATVIFSYALFTRAVRSPALSCAPPVTEEATTPPATVPMCGPGEEYSTCGPSCPETCEPSQMACDDACHVGCFCVPGLVRHNGQCIALEACPAGPEQNDIPILEVVIEGVVDETTMPPPVETTPPPPPEEPVCGAGEEFMACGSACPETCEPSGMGCIDECQTGCFCMAGLVRHNGECIERAACPVEPQQFQNSDAVTVAVPDPMTETEPAIETEMATTAPPAPAVTTEWSRQCQPDPTCAHYHPVGHNGTCCPACSQTIARDSAANCPPVRGCLRYATTFQDGEDCLRCVRTRGRINRSPRAVCQTVVCPRGMGCRKRSGQAVCLCKTCPECPSQ